VSETRLPEKPKAPPLVGGIAPVKSTASKRPWVTPIFSDQRQFLRSTSAVPNFTIRGRHRSPRDIYHWLLTTSWLVFAAIGLAAYLVSNTVFALLYLADPHGLVGARPGSFEDAFFFSVETIGTIGYGVLSPRNLYANIVMTAENFFGLSFIAVATGVIFARVSRPTARVMFSKNAVVAVHDGVLTLMFRAANERANRVLEAEVNVNVTRDSKTVEGRTMRRFEPLKLVRATSPLFALTWSILHIIDETSPLYGMTEKDLEGASGQLLVVLSGMDETFAQRIHARHSYLPEDIVWNKHFADVISEAEDGRRVVDYNRFHELEDVPVPELVPEVEAIDHSLEAE